jgi:hypothetical protein
MLGIKKITWGARAESRVFMNGGNEISVGGEDLEHLGGHLEVGPEGLRGDVVKAVAVEMVAGLRG